MIRLPLLTAVMLALGVPTSDQHPALLTTDEAVSAMR
jgi:hypothetical protein